ncbi:MAG TPA: class I SAM-dependent methyltransferase [Gemmata sp.]|nr:class I SAM-dependent methyltransferase [Gemmata sp.]
MPTLSGLRFRVGVIWDALTRPFSQLVTFPVAGLGVFDFLSPLVPGLPEVPPDLASAAHPEAGRQGVVESGEAEVARTLYILARLLNATRVAEVGVFRGYTTQFLAAALAPAGGVLHLIDASESALAEASGRAGGYAGCRVERHAGLSTDASILAAVPSDLDLVFLDADHSEPGVVAELSGWMPKVRAGGILAIHDSVNIRGVCRAVNRFTAGHPALTVATSRGSGLTLFRTAAEARR